MRLLLPSIVVALALAGAGTAADEPSPGCTADAGNCALLALRGGGAMPYYRNRPIGGTQPAIRRAIVVVHGDSRVADGALNSVVGAASAAQRAETIVVAPFFQPPRTDRPFQLAWNDGWKQGGLSTDQGPQAPRRSSFQILDAFLQQLATRASFPNLKEIVVAGHSAGGQIVQRYAALSALESGLGVPVRYVVSNPGSYMYLNERRWINGAFRIPPQPLRQVCPGWDRYRFGLDGRSGYAAEASRSRVLAQYPARLVTYLLGEADTGQGNLDDSCSAALQGRHRFDRGKTLFAFMTEFFPGHRHRLVTVPGGTHSASDMYRSERGRQVLYPPV